MRRAPLSDGRLVHRRVRFGMADHLGIDEITEICGDTAGNEFTFLRRQKTIRQYPQRIAVVQIIKDIPGLIDEMRLPRI